MIINQGYASDKISTLTRSLAKKIESELPMVRYHRELIADGEAFIASHAERHICIKVANGIELSTWQNMWGRKIEEINYRIDLPTDESELEYILWTISWLYEALLRNPYTSFFDSIFNLRKEAK